MHWKVIPEYYFNMIGKKFLIFQMNLSNIAHIPKLKVLPEFYFELTKTWIKYKNTNDNIPVNFRNIRQEVIWGNKYITLKGKSLLFTNWINSNLIYINDIIDEKGNISENYILQKLKFKHIWMIEITKIKNAIPKEWTLVLQKHDSIKTKVKMHNKITIKDKIIDNLSTKELYNLIKAEDTEIPIGFSKWMRILNNNEIKQKCKTYARFSTPELDRK